MISTQFPGVYWLEIDKRLATVNLAPGKAVYGENLVHLNGVELREWDPHRSKLAAAILKGLRLFKLHKGSRVLYLGAATGTTVSHVSDIVGAEGVVFAVEVSFRAMKQLISRIAQMRRNIIPILADANYPVRYKHLLWEADVLYCDVAQPNQTEIMLRNAELYLKSKGSVMMALKASSVDSVRPPKDVCDKEIAKMSTKIDVLERLDLEPFASSHEFIIGRLS